MSFSSSVCQCIIWCISFPLCPDQGGGVNVCIIWCITNRSLHDVCIYTPDAKWGMWYTNDTHTNIRWEIRWEMRKCSSEGRKGSVAAWRNSCASCECVCAHLSKAFYQRVQSRPILRNALIGSPVILMSCKLILSKDASFYGPRQLVLTLGCS